MAHAPRPRTGSLSTAPALVGQPKPTAAHVLICRWPCPEQGSVAAPGPAGAQDCADGMRALCGNNAGVSQDGAVRYFVLPLMTVEPDLQGGGVRMTAFEGTGFLLSEPADTVVTAGHVADKLEVGRAVVAFADDGGWFTWGIVRITPPTTQRTWRFWSLRRDTAIPRRCLSAPRTCGPRPDNGCGAIPWTSCTRSSRTGSPFSVRTSSTARATYGAAYRTSRWLTCEVRPSSSSARSQARGARVRR
jgi:hypothetical protein